MSFKFPKVVWFGHATPPSNRCDQGGSLSLHLTRKIGLRIFMSCPRRILEILYFHFLSFSPHRDRHATPAVARSGQTAMPYCKNTTRWPLCPSAGWLCGSGVCRATPTHQFFGVFLFLHYADWLLLHTRSFKVKYGQRAIIFHLFLFLQKINKPANQNWPVIKRKE